MFVVRNVFRLKYGQAKPALAAWKDGKEIIKKLGVSKPVRLLSDFVGPAYTLVLETSYDSLQEMEAENRKIMGNEQWGKWYHEKLVPHVEDGYREIWNVVE